MSHGCQSKRANGWLNSGVSSGEVHLLSDIMHTNNRSNLPAYWAVVAIIPSATSLVGTQRALASATT